MKHNRRIKRIQRKHYPVNLITKHLTHTDFLEELTQAIEGKFIVRYGNKAIYYNVS